MGEQLSFFDETEVTVQSSNGWLLIDGNNLMNRCYYATAHDPNNLMKAPDGRYTNAVSLFIKMMLKLNQSLGTAPIVMFDEGKSYRKEIYPAYKDGRKETPIELKEQFPLIKEVLGHAEIPVYSNAEFEADDFIASFAEQADGDIYILSNDRDVFQLINERVTVIVRKGKEDVRMTPELFQLEYAGLSPLQIVDLKSITGDSVDNIPGIDGIGDKGAIKLIQHFGTIEKMLVSEFPTHLNRYKEKVANSKEQTLFAKKLTTLHRDIPLNIKEVTINSKGLLSICNKLAIKNIDKLLY
ncbi:5'-3' exonuclease [Psychrobacillus sp. FSL H8-0484]|uniref:5'-3' exonuclease n=1 Tax=Psychrobacillus sp. FSL H8-0484 TaxID=2921390 RepID=UPI0030F6BD83